MRLFLQRKCWLRDDLIAYEPKGELAKLAVSRKDLDDSTRRLTKVSATQEGSTTQSRVQTLKPERSRIAFQDANMQRMVRMSRPMKRLIDDTEMTLMLSDRIIRGKSSMRTTNIPLDSHQPL